MSRGRWITLAVVLLLVAAGVGSAVVAGRATSQGAPAAVGQDCSRTTAQVRSPAATTVAGTGTRVAVLGDSWTSGFALADPEQGWAYVLSRALGWRAAVDGFPGSGFTTDAGCPGQRYAQRVDRIPVDAALVLVEGGINDLPDPAAVGAASSALLAQVHARVPGAAVVVVGPPLVPARSPATAHRVAADLARSAAAQGATWVDSTGWTLPYLPDGVHLTAAGHGQFADLVAARLQAAHLVAAPSPAG
jgi:acyl-CoA thioesterase I